MDFTLTGFLQDREIRHYTFQGTEEDRTRRQFTVDADLGLLRKYGIALQELPLLCRRLLERNAPSREVKVVTFSEDLMREHADECAALRRAAQEKKKTYRRPKSNRLGQGWRNPTP
ncbi:MAG: hypothetical protein LAP40_23590 [Acidobacteriia bacterium]|nr:hypothetical protein [Terriglobia bacterium]